MTRFFSVLILLTLVSCGPMVPVLDTDKLSSSQLDTASKVKIYTLGNSADAPDIDSFLTHIEAYSCKHLIWDPPASKNDALIQLRTKAAELGADGVIDVTFDKQGTDTFGTNCWESVYVGGMAVKFK